MPDAPVAPLPQQARIRQPRAAWRFERQEYWAPDRIRPAPYNPRRIDDGEFATLKAGLEHFGLLGGLDVRADDGLCLGGHQRLKACLAVIAEHAGDEAWLASRNFPGGRIPVNPVRGVTDAEAAAVNVLLNNPRAQGRWDMGGLASVVSQLDAEGFDVSLTGFDDAAVEELVHWSDAGDHEPSITAGAPARKTLAERFGVPPFSVLDARQGYWLERKRAWVALGIRSEIGRGGALLSGGSALGVMGGKAAWERGESGGAPAEEAERRAREATPGGGGPNSVMRGGLKGGGYGAGKKGRRADARSFGQDLMRGEDSHGGTLMQSASGRDPTYYLQKQAVEKILGREIPTADFEAKYYENRQAEGTLPATGTSIFDPVLCEVAYRWFSAPGATVLDPFAGGSVRGIVAGLLGRRYIGIDLRAEQIEANEAQAAGIFDASAGEASGPLKLEGIVPVRPTWLVGDSRDLPTLTASEADLVFTCPPYADLERYSDDPRDLSTLGYQEFREAYREIIARACERLRADRFAVIVVGEVRSSRPGGPYHGFVQDTIAAFEAAGLAYYNEAILVTPLGSLPVRAARQFTASRKVGKTHQNVLVFVKGDAMRAADACGSAEFGALEAPIVPAGAEGEGEALGEDPSAPRVEL